MMKVRNQPKLRRVPGMGHNRMTFNLSVSVSVEYWAGTSLLNIVPRKWVACSLY
jgi:hypothetical protein